MTVTGLHCSPANELWAERNGAKSRVDGKFWTDSDLRFPESLNACLESLNVYLESLNACLESLNAYPESLNVCLESLNVYPESLNVCLESLNAYLESLNVNPECLNVYLESLNGLSDLNLVRAKSLGNNRKSLSVWPLFKDQRPLQIA